MRRTLTLLVAFLLSQAALCSPNLPQPPKPPAPRTVLVIVSNAVTAARVKDAVVTIGTAAGDVLAGTPTNGSGETRVLNVPGALVNYQLSVIAAGYFDYSQPKDLAAGEPTVMVQLTPRPPPPPPPNQSAGEQFQIHSQGPVFLRSDGTRYLWNGASDFALFQRFQRGEDIDPLLTQRVKADFTLLRVLGMYAHGIADPAGLPIFQPLGIPNYYDRLAQFADKLASRGLRVEFVVFADAQVLVPALADQQAHLDRVGAVLAGKWNVSLEVCNEPFKNGVDVDALRVPAGFVYALGNYNVDGKATIKLGTYLTYHTDRKPDWPRTARSLEELFRPLTWANGVTWVGAGVPVVSDEPTGFAELKDGDKRSADPDEAAWHAGISVMFGAGATFHSDDGVYSRVWRPKQLEAAQAWSWAMHWVPADAIFAPYQRGEEFGGAGFGHMPLQHLDTWASRTYCKLVGEFEYCIASQPTGLWKAEALAGWKIVEQPRLGFVKLARSQPMH